MSIVIKNVKTTKEYYESFMEIHKKITEFPGKLMEQLKTETSITGFGRGMRIVKFSDLINGTWSPRSRVSNYINLRKDVIENFCERLYSYSHKGNIDAIMLTLNRIKEGHRARIPKAWTDYLDADEVKALSSQAGKKYDFFNMGGGFIFNEDERRFVFDFTKEYFNLK